MEKIKYNANTESDLSKPYLTVADLALRLRCAEETIRRRIREGKIKSKFFGGKHLIAQDAAATIE